MKSNLIFVWIVILIPPLALLVCCINGHYEPQPIDREWRANHDKYKWGYPPMPHGDDTNSVMDPWGTNGWGR